MRNAAVSTVVHSPRLSPTADCVIFIVRTILLEIRYTSFFSSHERSGSNSTFSVVASISAASSSAYSPATSSVSPNEWCSLKYPYIGRSLGSANPILAAIRRCGSFVEFSLITVNATCPGLISFNPSLREISLQLGGKIELTRTMLHAAIPAFRSASSKLDSLSRCFPTPLVRKIFFATNAILLSHRPGWIFLLKIFYASSKVTSLLATVNVHCATNALLPAQENYPSAPFRVFP